MRKIMLVSVVLLAVVLIMVSDNSAQAARKERPAPRGMADMAYPGWRLGTQAYSFKLFTFFEAVDKTASLGLHWIEPYTKQTISKDIDVPFAEMNDAQIRKVKAKLREAKVRISTYGVVRLSTDEAECRKVFDFAKKLGVQTIVSEPPAEAFKLLDRLCEEYDMSLAVHNHPKKPTTKYWGPESVLKVCKGRSERIGACADVGHWVRSGLDPVECLKKLEGRIISLHFKEIDDGHDVIWGQGQSRAKALLTELDRQKFKGVFSIEYEHNWENSVPEIRESVKYFNQVAGELAAGKASNARGARGKRETASQPEKKKGKKSK